MTNARALVYQGVFSDAAQLPKANLFYTSPLQYALYDWCADGLELGPLASWTSLVGDLTLPADQGLPSVVDSGGSRAVRFDGSDDRMRVQFSRATPHTIAVVYRLTSVTPGDSIVHGYNGASTGSIVVGDPLNTIAGYATGPNTWLIPNPYIAPDTNWHVALLCINGSTSTLRVDGREANGPLPSGTRDGISLGYSSAADGHAAIEYKRVTVFTGAATATQRDSIVNTLAARYAIGQ
ncbi:hypothetical protein [Glutamicibacter protophormiae]|uniref:hypothetical protein n=1 Tax=Glutamicibacter protophormiae TaxID=37930 RepID=UPI00195BFBD9|nr:hypothetical protein [Glutamicibacter protophormiae]QRQ79093.1 hypothetical protein JQN66_02220 [Glutamicibacter protophormiae]